VRRLLLHILVAVALTGGSLLVGIAGYSGLAGLRPVDAFLNAAMILGGMGPVDPLTTNAAKVFASFYALFSGLVFIGVLGLLLAPFIHRVMHKLHMDYEEDSK
ncbi:MAG: hypothetical protein QOE68_4213, partial [Thermoanaerobaculia bacterium]|nr:hypothetical protein [Thermoanaerobaculia bacterium]